MSIKALLMTLLAAIGIPVATVLILFTLKTIVINERSEEQLTIEAQQGALMDQLALRLRDQEASLLAQTEAINEQYKLERQIAAIETLRTAYKVMEASYLNAIIMRRASWLNTFKERSADLRDAIKEAHVKMPLIANKVKENLDQHLKDIDESISLFGITQ